LLFHVPVQLHLAGVEQASDPYDGKDEQLLDEKSSQNPGKIELRDDFFEQDIDHCHGHLEEKDQIEESECGKWIFEDKSESFQSGFDNITALFQDDLDSGIIKHHLDKEKKNEGQCAEAEFDEKRSDFRE
jgi:hypothetical protein